MFLRSRSLIILFALIILAALSAGPALAGTDLSGEWQIINNNTGKFSRVVLTQSGNFLSGTRTVDDGKLTVPVTGTISGSILTLVFPHDAKAVEYYSIPPSIAIQVSGINSVATFTVGTNNNELTGTFSGWYVGWNGSTVTLRAEGGTPEARAHNTPWPATMKRISSVPTTATTAVGTAVNLRATPGDRQVSLEWNAAGGSKSVIGYNLYRGTRSGGQSRTPVTDFPVKGINYTDRNVDNGMTYYYICKPVYSDKTEGPASNEVAVTPAGSSGYSQYHGVKIVLQIDNPYMTVNGIRKEIDPGRGTAPIIVNGRTMLPIRAVIEAMTGTIGWDGNEQKVTINLKGTSIELWIDSKRTRVNGVEKTTDVAPQVINGRTMIPLRFVIENLPGCEVNWDGETNAATISFTP